jgi:hypothetical protein
MFERNQSLFTRKPAAPPRRRAGGGQSPFERYGRFAMPWGAGTGRGTKGGWDQGRVYLCYTAIVCGDTGAAPSSPAVIRQTQNALADWGV